MTTAPKSRKVGTPANKKGINTADTLGAVAAVGTPTQEQRHADILKLRDSLRRVQTSWLGGVVDKCAQERPEVSNALQVVYLLGVTDGLEGAAAPAHLQEWGGKQLNSFWHHFRDLCNSRIAQEAAGWH